MHTWLRSAIAAAVAVVLMAGPLYAWIHDVDQNKIDDRIENVNANGWTAAFEDNDPTKRLKLGAFNGPEISYAVYVGYDHYPTQADADALTATGVPFVKPYLYIDYIRTQATFAQIQTIAGMPGVTRVESIPMMYPANHIGSRVVRARDSRGLNVTENYVLFPSARDNLGLDGTGVVVGILDTGVNDAPDSINPSYPGHESLAGKFLGGGNFFSGQPLLNTPLTASENPEDHADYHGTHVAGSAIGSGGVSNFFTGVAPAARLVDCKVLSDAGAGFGSADGVEWCIFNKDNDWGLTGADTIYAGIDVLNLSLGCLDCNSDGTDAGSQMINAAVDAGLVVCLASGNDDGVNQISSPGGADKGICVGASATQVTLDRGDDDVTSFSNEGVRADDGDLDKFDEMKPNVVAPGAGIFSANGDWTTDGTSYSKLSGTSMASPHVAGVAALVVQANPSLDPLQVRDILQNTAIHHIPSQKGNRPADPFGVDPNYNPMSGWGLVDAYAAGKEALNSTSGVQVVRIRPVARPLDGEVDVMWWTQREYTNLGFNVHRAPDVGGAPGTFTQINTVIISPVGDPNIAGDDNRTPYVYVDNDPALTLGETYWYQIEWLDVGGSHLEPPAPATLGEAPRIMTGHYSISHSTADNDLLVKFGTSSSYTVSAAEFFVLGPGEALRDSFQLVVELPGGETTVERTLGNTTSFWSLPFFQGDGVEPYLPPSFSSPWFLHVEEGGFVNRTGRTEAFSMFIHDAPGSASGTTYVTDSVTPQPHAEGTSVTLWIPEQQPVPVKFASMSVAAEDDGIRLVLDLVEEEPGATVRVSRARSADMSARRTVSPTQPMPGTHFEFVDDNVEGGITYWYWVEVTDRFGSVFVNGPVSTAARTGVFARTLLAGAMPNPVRAASVFHYTVGADAARDGAAPVRLTLHDVQGRVVRTLVDASQEPGSYELRFDGTSDSGRVLPRGLYYVQLRAGQMVRNAKITLVR